MHGQGRFLNHPDTLRADFRPDVQRVDGESPPVHPSASVPVEDPDPAPEQPQEAPQEAPEPPQPESPAPAEPEFSPSDDAQDIATLLS